MSKSNEQAHGNFSGLRAAQEALKENQRLLDPGKNKIAHNWNIALAAMLLSQARIQEDLDLLHRKIQPIRRYLDEELGDNWRDRLPRYEE